MKTEWLLEPQGCPGFLRSEMVSHIEKGENIHHTEHLYVNLPKRYALVNITDLVEDCLGRSGVIDGLCFVSAMHITAGIYVNDAEGGLLKDISENGGR